MSDFDPLDDSWAVFERDGFWWFVSEYDDETNEGDELCGPYDTKEEAVAAFKDSLK